MWWDKKFDHADIAEVAVNKLLSVRREALMDLGMEVGYKTTDDLVIIVFLISRTLPIQQQDISTMSTSITLDRMVTVFPQDGEWVRALTLMVNPSLP